MPALANFCRFQKKVCNGLKQQNLTKVTLYGNVIFTKILNCRFCTISYNYFQSTQNQRDQTPYKPILIKYYYNGSFEHNYDTAKTFTQLTHLRSDY